MEIETAKQLALLNTGFYEAQAAAFSSSRQAAWPGWQTSLAMISAELVAGKSELAVFDLACGNLRYATFLREQLPQVKLDYSGVDNCDSLHANAIETGASYQHLDILETLFSGQQLSAAILAPRCDLAVCFGFMHHVPLPEQRQMVLASLIQQACPGAYVIVTLWQFMRDYSRRDKALAAHEQALQELGLRGLDENDFLLGWNDLPGVWRYCHSFSDAEVDGLIDVIADAAKLIARFCSDGKTGKLNTYLVFKTNE